MMLLLRRGLACSRLGRAAARRTYLEKSRDKKLSDRHESHRRLAIRTKGRAQGTLLPAVSVVGSSKSSSNCSRPSFAIRARFVGPSEPESGSLISAVCRSAVELWCLAARHRLREEGEKAALGREL